MTWTADDAMKMDNAAGEAEAELKSLLSSSTGPEGHITDTRLMAWWKKWYMKAGHKRLFRIADRLIK
jgi:hypothetical protein